MRRRTKSERARLGHWLGLALCALLPALAQGIGPLMHGWAQGLTPADARAMCFAGSGTDDCGGATAGERDASGSDRDSRERQHDGKSCEQCRMLAQVRLGLSPGAREAAPGPMRIGWADALRTADRPRGLWAWRAEARGPPTL